MNEVVENIEIFEWQATEANNIDLQDTDKLQYFADTEFNNNGVIFRSLSLFFRGHNYP